MFLIYLKFWQAHFKTKDFTNLLSFYLKQLDGKKNILFGMFAWGKYIFVGEINSKAFELTLSTFNVNWKQDGDLMTWHTMWLKHKQYVVYAKIIQIWVY